MSTLLAALPWMAGAFVTCLLIFTAGLMRAAGKPTPHIEDEEVEAWLP